jgi:aminopeptidase N
MVLRVFLIILFTAMTVLSQQPKIEPGVSQALAKWRAANYSDVRYKLDLTLEKMSPVLKGTIEIRVNLSVIVETEPGPGRDIILDWRKIRGKEDLSTVSNISLNGKPAKFEETSEHIVISGAASGENTVRLEFTSPILTTGSAITRYLDRQDQGEYIYSLFVPSDASTAFPVFDQPDLKAVFKLSASLPEGWNIVSNGLPNVFRTAKSIEFFETRPISPYVFAFAAGDFKIFTEKFMDGGLGNGSGTSSDAREISEQFRAHTGNYIYVRRSQAEKFKQHAEEVFRLNREGVKFLESYFDYKFPFPKYDLVLIPEFPFGGMEHAGATFLREEAVIFPQEPTANNYISRANVIFHEAAHQWFGDTVTMRWFDDLWLKEGFAEFMAYKTLEKVMPEYNAWKVFYERNKQAAYLTDSTKGTTPIYQEIPNLSSAKSAYGNIVYRKAPSFLKQAEFYLGEDKFQKAVRAFLKKHEYANAGWEDLVKEFENSSSKNLKEWANIWVKRRGLPIFRMKTERVLSSVLPRSGARETKLVFSQSDGLREETVWPEKLEIFYIYDDGTTRSEAVAFGIGDKVIEEVWGVDAGELVSKASRRDMRLPRLIFPNYRDYGYGIFLLDEKSKKYVLENIQNEKDDFLRTMMWGSLWDSVREAELDPKDYVELVIKNLGSEKDEVTISTLLGRVSTAMNYYLADKQREQAAPRLEALLLGKMSTAETLGQKLTFYRSFLNIASTSGARKTLKELLKAGWGKPVVKEGITPAAPAPPVPYGIPPLKTKDKFDILTRLIILNDPEAPGLLAELEKIETSDEAKRYAYAARAGIASAGSKAKIFEDFTSNKEISESWIEAAFGPFNSVRHSDLTLPYLERALAELPNLKRNRKIFFVNGWLGAFIGGQRSEQALAIVDKFLAANPNLDKDLRLKVLENVDGLDRAVRIRKKFNKYLSSARGFK